MNFTSSEYLYPHSFTLPMVTCTVQKVGWKSVDCRLKWDVFVQLLNITDSVQGAAAQESIDSVVGEESTVSVEQPTTHSVPSSSGCSGSIQSGIYSFATISPPQPSTAVHAYVLWWVIACSTVNVNNSRELTEDACTNRAAVGMAQLYKSQDACCMVL